MKTVIRCFLWAALGATLSLLGFRLSDWPFWAIYAVALLININEMVDY